MYQPVESLFELIYQEEFQTANNNEGIANNMGDLYTPFINK